MPRKKKDLFYNIFIGELVEITTKSTIKTVKQEEDQITEQTVPVIFQAYLLDMDEEYYYLGQDPDEVFSALRKDQCIYIAIVRENSILDDALDDLEVPENSNEVN